MKAVLDEMVPAAIAKQLRKRGHDVMAVVEHPQLLSLNDREQLALATQDGRALVTRDIGDYVTLDREYRARGEHHAGIILISSSFKQMSVGPLVKALDSALAAEPPFPGFVHWL